MSSTSSQASAVSVSDSNEPECEPSRSARSSHIAVPCSVSIGPTYRSMRTSEPLPLTGSPQMALALTSYAEGSPVRTSASQARGSVLRDNEADYGVNSPVSFASYDLASSSWKTSQRCLIEGWETFSETWPRSGMMRSGIAYQRQPLAPRTIETAYGSLLPTPTRDDGRGFYVASLNQAQNRVKDGRQMHWIHPALLSKRLNKGWANPQFSEALMGFPIRWSDLAPSEMPSSRKSRKRSGGQS